CAASSSSCAIGDDCSATFNQGISDPCIAHGLFCAYLGINSSNTAYVGACLVPFVVDPTNGFPFSNWAGCNPSNNLCAPVNGSAQSTASVCASFWGANRGNPVCMQGCQTSNDCTSMAENCVNGACVPVICWADDVATPGAVAFYNSYQGSPV